MLVLDRIEVAVTRLFLSFGSLRPYDHKNKTSIAFLDLSETYEIVCRKNGKPPPHSPCLEEKQ